MGVYRVDWWAVGRGQSREQKSMGVRREQQGMRLLHHAVSTRLRVCEMEALWTRTHARAHVCGQGRVCRWRSESRKPRPHGPWSGGQVYVLY